MSVREPVVGTTKIPDRLDRSWVTRGACQGMDTEIWYPHDADEPAIGRAKAVCRTCPVQAACLDWALAIPSAEDWGVIGGTTKHQRARLRANRARRKARTA